MGNPAFEALGKVTNRFTKFHFILLILLITILLLTFGDYSSRTSIDNIWKHIPRPHQEFVSSETGTAEDKNPPGEKSLGDTQGSADGNNAYDSNPNSHIHIPSSTKEAAEMKAEEDKQSASSKSQASSQSDKPSEASPSGAAAASNTVPPTESSIDAQDIRPAPPPADDEEYIGICLLVKNDASELKEFFVHHYYHHGIRRFYIYDDGSEPPLENHPDLSSYDVPDSVLTFSYIEPDTIDPKSKERERLQQSTMERCIKEHGSKHHWLGLLDPDEYLEMRHAEFPTLKGWLQKWEKEPTCGAMAVSWLPHDSADLVEIPQIGMRKSYNRCVSGGRGDYWLITHNKSFVRPYVVKEISNIHSVTFNNETMKRYGEHQDDATEVSRKPPTHEYWALHHYGTGSRKFFEYKQSRGRSQGPDRWPVNEGYWDRYHKGVTNYECNEMTTYEP